MRPLVSAALLLALASCASLSKEECLNGNWDEIGFRDGTNGRTSAYIQEHAKACAESGVVPNQSVWEQGRLRGLPAYCVPSKAYSEGRAGRSLRAVCPAEQIPALRAANKKGLEYRRYDRDLRAAEARLDEINRHMIFEQNADVRFSLFREAHTLRQNIRLLEQQRRRFETL